MSVLGCGECDHVARVMRKRHDHIGKWPVVNAFDVYGYVGLCGISGKGHGKILAKKLRSFGTDGALLNILTIATTPR